MGILRLLLNMVPDVIAGSSHGSKIYEDDNGYYRFNDSDKPVHRWAAEKKLGRALRRGEVVHHKNRNKKTTGRKTSGYSEISMSMIGRTISTHGSAGKGQVIEGSGRKILIIGDKRIIYCAIRQFESITVLAKQNTLS
ncbi:MAG TPA: hypothetical protein VLM75_01775 [Spirochaetota bacterium]|nr:hypothetical protein [Spirochaetota bacterium]